MTVLLLVLLVAIAITFWKRNQLGEKANLVLGVLVVLAIVAVAVRLAASRRPAASVANVYPEFYHAAGAKLGAAIAAAQPEGGAVLVIHPGMSGAVMTKITRARIEGLQKGFGTAPFRIVEAGPKSEAEYEAMFAVESQLPLSELLKYLELAPDARAIVSLVGPPNLVGAGARPLPPIYLFEMVDRAMAEDLLRAGQIRGAVLFKDNADWKALPKRGMTEDEVFNLRYEILPPAR